MGSCKNIEARVRKHNTNHKGFTGRIGDWKPVYHEEFPSKGEAVTREKEIKGWKSRLLIEKLIGSRWLSINQELFIRIA